MKIAQVCPYDLSRPGGVKNHIFSLSEALGKLGHQVSIIAPDHGESSKNNIHYFGKNRSLNISGTKIDINIALGKERKELKRFIENEKFDIIHYHTFWNPILPFQVWNHSQAKNICTFHDTPKSKLIGKTIMPLAAKLVFKMMDQVISVSRTQAKFIGGLNPQKVKIIPNGINLSPFKKSKAQKIFDDGKFNLLFLGRLEPRKGVGYALKAYQNLRSENENIRLIIAGDGQERSLVESFMRDHPTDDIEFLGQVDEATKYNLLKTANLYLATAIYGESFGIVLLEAMASGLPMVGFGNEGYLNIISDQWQEYFPSPKDLKNLTLGIKKMIQDEGIRKKMRDWGIEEVKKYDWKILAKEIETIYTDSLK